MAWLQYVCLFFILFSALGWIWTGIILGFAAFALTYIFHLSQAEVIFREDGAIFLNKDETLYVLSFEDILRVEFYDDASPGGRFPEYMQRFSL